MTGILISIHVIICTLLIAIILIQRGRGGGLAEGLSDVESMFGTKTSAFLSRATTALSILFFITCLSLALLAARQSRSLMKDTKLPAAPRQTQTPKVEEKAVTAQAQEAPKTE